MTRENFPVALRVLPQDIREDLEALYRFARHVDDVGDESTGDRLVELKALAEDIRTLYDGGVPDATEVAGLHALVRRRAVPPDPWLALVEANVRDQSRSRYGTFDELVDYCTLSADPVGRVVLHVFGQAYVELLPLSDRICTGLQLVEHWQDVREDYLRGRVYLPGEDLARFGVAETDLGRTRATPQLRALMRFETERASAWLDAGAPLVRRLRGWGRLAVAGYLAGGRAAVAGLRRRGYDPLAGVPKPTGREVATELVRGGRRRR